MFKRRDPKSYLQLLTEMFYPRGGWRRASQYVLLRMRRLPDQPSRVARGFACGVFISFTPFFGFHFIGAAVCAWLIRGNILAALLGTFIGNPMTTPFMALASLTCGRWLLGRTGDISIRSLPMEFAQASGEVWHNLMSIFTGEAMVWSHLTGFYNEIFLPYAVGSVIPGLIVGVIFHYSTVPLIRAWHERRAKKMAARIAQIKAMQQQAAQGDRQQP